MNDSWRGTVVSKRRGLMDGSNMYRRLKIRQTDGTTKRVRVSKELWSSVEEGDIVVQTPDGELRRE